MSYALARNYQTQALMTASPAELVAMLFERAIHLMRETERAIEEGRIEARHNANTKAMEIIHHLDVTLDRDQGGEIAEQLTSLYSFVLRRLADVDRLNDANIPRDMIGLLEPLRDSWRTLARDGATAAPARPLPAPPKSAALARPETPAAPIPAGLNFSA
ncbi:flagellar export chaperone FliS [Algihabitans albus]|uniref:flagellar export chaperone FliS n=1 Tax=Algihabitans albus TaxID=2164067 RepID=UPI000E5C6346|nr:flagellar export chaperone FliS [Algihabitans albus]